MRPFRILPILFVLLAMLVSLRADPLDIWTKRTSGTGANLYGVAHGAERFVTVGQYGTRLVSSNGTDWAFAPDALNPTFFSIAYGAGLFIAVGEWGSIYTSGNGMNWVSQNSHTTNGLLCVRWVKDRFMATGGQGALVSSTNGVDWVAQNSGTPDQLTAVAYGSGMFMVAGQTNSNYSTILRSLDGETWSQETVDFSQFYDLAHYGDRFLALNPRGQVRVSTNGHDWSLVFGTVNFNYNFAITHVHDRFVAVGGPFGGGSQKIVSSPDGFAWELHPVSVNHSGTLRAVAVGNNTVVAVGEKGLIVQSDSLFRLGIGAVLAGGGREWILHGEPGRNYRFQYSPNFAGGLWLDITNFTSTNDVISLQDTLPPSPTNRFYRVTSP